MISYVIPEMIMLCHTGNGRALKSEMTYCMYEAAELGTMLDVFL